ncbi:MAG: pilus assembly protein PilM [Erysipelotrichaceae bacterium]|nr:pilus assembly protein PilM [Erysipelotrichaceae bacterium]
MANILGIEIGNKTVKVVEIKGNTLKNFAVVDLPDNIVVNNELIAFEAMGDLLKDIVREHRMSTRRAALVLPDTAVYLRRMVLPAMNEKQLAVNMPYEFKDVLSEEKDKYIYDYSMIGYRKDEEDKVTEMELLGAVANRGLIEKYQEMFKRAGLKLVKAGPRETALSCLVNILNEDSEKKDFAILDIGYKSTKVEIFKEGVYEVTRTIDSGAEDIVNVVSEVFDVDPHVASTFLETNKDNVQENEKCVDIYSSIATEVMRVMNYYSFENRDSTLDTLYYCGGGSYIPRFIEEIKEMVSLELEPLSSLSEVDKDAIGKCAPAIGACYE